MPFGGLLFVCLPLLPKRVFSTDKRTCIKIYLEVTESPDFRCGNQAVLFYGTIILQSETWRFAQG